MIRIAIFSDVHANLNNFNVFLEQAQQQGVTHYWFLGDAIGRGSEPIETLIALHNLLTNASNSVALAGNHDRSGDKNLVALGDAVVQPMNEMLMAQDQIHGELCSYHAAEAWSWLKGLHSQTTSISNFEGVYLAHGYYDVNQWGQHPLEPSHEYVSLMHYTHQPISGRVQGMEIQNRGFIPKILGWGHTHKAQCWVWNRQENSLPQRFEFTYGTPIQIAPLTTHTLMINPGSIHDGASWALLNFEPSGEGCSIVFFSV
jgi:predicted phosphodiesterase